MQGNKNLIRVFVLLAHNKDHIRWAIDKRNGNLVGRNDMTPYGYGRAREMNCEVEFSTSYRDRIGKKVLRLGMRAVLGFDLVHAWNNRRAMTTANVVWTHTESQFLAAAAVLMFSSKRPRLIGQAVWLFDRWPRIPFPLKALYKYLIGRTDVLTTLSPENARFAAANFPTKRVEFIPFGIPSENPVPPVARTAERCRVLAVGNDRHRDWNTLVEALKNIDNIELTILSGTAGKSLSRNAGNVQIMLARTDDVLKCYYARATVAIVPLIQNLHASGITAIQEAILAGVPVVATDVGGLRAYFDSDEITYVPPMDAKALREAIIDVAREPEAARSRTARAQRKILSAGLDAAGYVRRHVELSQEIVR